MLGTISFIGGIHGVGKSTNCTNICQQTGLQYLSASELIKWKEINSDAFNKKVVNIPGTQDRLLRGLSQVTKVGKHYLLDGHYCLVDGLDNICPIPDDVFKQIAPVSLHVIVGNILEIKDRLEKRDAKKYDANMLHRMQETELKHAKHLSLLFNVNLTVGTHNNYSDIVEAINHFHKT